MYPAKRKRHGVSRKQERMRARFTGRLKISTMMETISIIEGIAPHAPARRRLACCATLSRNPGAINQENDENA
jgi:hypothetical protein